MMLRREPDPVGFEDYVTGIATGRLTRHEVIDAIRASEEFRYRVPYTARMLGHSIHQGRCEFIHGLPPARRILDLGGTHLHNDVGAMVAMGYPYPFEELIIVDLPPDDRHPIYRKGDEEKDALREVTTHLGPVRYRYHSMTDLSAFQDDSFDLVYSGQSIEHVTPDDGDLVLKEVFRVLRTGGHLAVDTPNGRVTRLKQEAFIDPDHKVEYTPQELTAKLEQAGFEVVEAKGLNYAGPALDTGRYDDSVVARNEGIFAAADDCYILAYLCRKPPTAGAAR
jgi:SAM-dependent methyltransferase